jgi:hypothetical protein
MRRRFLQLAYTVDHAVFTVCVILSQWGERLLGVGREKQMRTSFFTRPRHVAVAGAIGLLPVWWVTHDKSVLVWIVAGFIPLYAAWSVGILVAPHIFGTAHLLMDAQARSYEQIGKGWTSWSWIMLGAILVVLALSSDNIVFRYYGLLFGSLSGGLTYSSFVSRAWHATKQARL